MPLESIGRFFRKIEARTTPLWTGIPIIRGFFHRHYELRSFVGIGALIISFISFTTAFLIAFTIHQDILKKRSIEASQKVSEQVLNSMLELMKKGWTRDELERFLRSLKGDTKKEAISINLYRGETIERVHGKVPEEEMEEDVRDVFVTGNALTMRDAFIYPIKAEEGCLSCHSYAKKGEVLGVIKVSHDISSALAQGRKRFLLLSLILIPIPFLMAGLISSFLNAKIGLSTELLHRRIAEVRGVKDLAKLKLEDTDLGFTELNKALSEVHWLTTKIRSVAIDRDMLEFQSKILEKFIITSELIKGWKEYTGNLLLEINKVIEVYTLFSIFQIEAKRYDLDIFWREAPSDATREIVEKVILNRIHKDTDKFREGNLHVSHNIVDNTKTLNNLTRDDIDIHTKTLILEVPQIGGVVGIGVQSKTASDPIRSLMIESILTTLMNVIGSVKAISKSTADLEYYATRDPLTNLYNQRMFWELLHYEIGRAKRYGYKFSLLVIDLDNFKNINDSYGHIFGDKFLLEFASGLRKSLRQGDILARYGGDEFVVTLPETDEVEAILSASRIMESLREVQLLAPDGSNVNATVSIGISVFPHHADNAKDLFLFADNMMYKAKEAGRDTIMTPSEEDLIDVIRMPGEMALTVKRAIEDKSIIPYFQPIINLKTGEMECHEVLSRIKTDRGILEAAEFIEAGERMGVLTRLDRIAMEKAFEQVKYQGYHGYLFINLSPRSLILKGFIPNVLILAKEYEMDPSRIVFEITERETVKNVSLVEGFVHDLRAQGFRFAIDDFGAGFASFHYIKRFKPDFVKIEGEFIKGMNENKADAAIVKTLSVLSKEIQISTIAEHVEDEETLEALKRLDIDYAQGYYIGIPSMELKGS